MLIDELRRADLLVVGRRGHGGFISMLIGSVSQHRTNGVPLLFVAGEVAQEMGLNKGQEQGARRGNQQDR